MRRRGARGSGKIHIGILLPTRLTRVESSNGRETDELTVQICILPRSFFVLMNRDLILGNILKLIKIETLIAGPQEIWKGEDECPSFFSFPSPFPPLPTSDFDIMDTCPFNNFNVLYLLSVCYLSKFLPSFFNIVDKILSNFQCCGFQSWKFFFLLFWNDEESPITHRCNCAFLS